MQLSLFGNIRNTCHHVPLLQTPEELQCDDHRPIQDVNHHGEASNRGRMMIENNKDYVITINIT